MSNELSARDASILRHMLKYCREIDEALAYFGDDEALFMESAVFRNAVSMPSQQIGELAKHLSDAFIDAHPQMPWRQIKALRNIIVHNYGAVDAETAWEIIHEDIPALRDYC